ncbi:MAG: N-acetylmuramoyl-L-alanine amidase family protein [Gammaproteobacteria bacterium]
MQIDAPKKFAPVFWLLLFFLPATAGAGTSQPAPTWNCRVRAGQTQLDFMLPGRVAYHYFHLSHPQRLVIDFASTHEPRQFANEARGCGLVESLHWAEHKHQVLRYVLRLTRKAPVQLVPSPRKKSQKFRLSVRIGTLQKSDTGNGRTKSTETGTRETRQHFLQINPSKGDIVIAIDPGHGGIDPGTHGPHGLDEKIVTLAIAKMLAHKIDATPGLTAFLTRHSDRYVALRRRVLEAQSHHAALFISIHANAYPKLPSVEGGAVYALSEHGASNAEAGLVARTENAADPTIGDIRFAAHNHEVNSALTQMLQRASITRGSELGTDVLKNLSHYEPLYEHHVQYANFEVLRDPLIPSILVETAFLSNPHQAQEFHERHFRQDLATAIYHGIREFLAHHDLRTAQVVGSQRSRETETEHPVQPDRDQRAAAERTYRVRSGDTLSGVALRLHVSQWRLQAYNHLRGRRLRIGRTLKVPPPSFKYRVKPGDSLSVIAAKAGVTPHRIEAYNGLDSSVLKVGQVLKLPSVTNKNR